MASEGFGCSPTTASATAYSEVLPDEKRGSCLRFLFNALRFFRSLGVKVHRVMPGNGVSFRSRRYATNLREWAYARAYDTSEQRAAELPVWLHRYNWHRRYGSIGSKPPISRLGLTENNLLRLNS